ncbi:ester cyclase [Actinomadura rudentiformis]|uniref:Ester cyclase n=1 Tax=Actinomadura rudentiformis TaxID=359158 RepID=A0A6H9YTE4_9ACTN|nr:ester cyclase [Actinomadura rudentiformis]KAB2347440.1 ester cyclase [Actinomadura rudentiformis]
MAGTSDVVRTYAEAKSRSDITAALAVCHPDVIFETIPFQAVAHGADEARAQFTGFLRAFPDYNVELEYLAESGDLVIGAGTIHATMKDSLAGIAPTGRSYALPFACHWTVRNDLITHERFFFDFHQMCEQLGLSTDEAGAHLAIWRERTNPTP